DRFSPTMRDATFGYVLHPVDLAINKVMAAAGGHEVRDLVDLVMIHDTILPLGVVIWVAVDESPGFTPEGLIVAMRRTAYYAAVTGQPAPTSMPHRSSITSSHQVLHNISYRTFGPLCQKTSLITQ